MREELKEYINRPYVKKGIYYGYPSCCIIAFTNNEEKSDSQIKVSEYRGFIPCKQCTEKIVSGKETLSSLIKNRECPYEFPIDDMDMMKL